jgi:hypothetical protein
MRLRLDTSRLGAESHSISTVDVVLENRTRECKDPRDSIYAFLGMSTSQNMRLEVDYSQSIAQVSASFLEVTSKQLGDISFLRLAGIGAIRPPK